VFVWRGMRWRLGISLLTVLTSAIAVGAAVLGPLYLETAGDSVLRRAVSSAAVESRGLTLNPASGRVGTLAQLHNGERLVREAAGRWYGAPIDSVVSGVTIAAPRAVLVRSQLLFRTGICRRVHFVQGGCATGFGDVALSERSARELGVSIGALLDARVPGRGRPLALRITGIYAVPSLQLPYWWGDGNGYFPFGQTSGPQRIPEVDSLLSSAATALAVPPDDSPQIIGQLPLLASRVGLSSENPLRAAVSRAGTAVGADGLALSTQLPSLLRAADRQRHTMSTIVAVAALQLVLLAVWVLAGLLLRGGATRQAEIRVARLRGFPPVSLLAVIALEPALLCTAGLLLGLGGAWGTMVLVRAQVLDHAAVISADGWVFAALGASVAAIAGALGFALMRGLRSWTLADSAQTEQRRARRTGALVDVALLVLSAVGVVTLATNGSLSGHSNPIASAAPGLIALGTAVIAVQLVLFTCRLGVSASAYSKRIALFIALRQIVRRPALMRQTRVLIIALCLACFAVSAWSVARSNRASAAQFTVGTVRVATVTAAKTGLVQAVDRADPHGRFAMAAVEVRTASSTLLGVQASRLGAAISWPAGISRARLGTIRHRIDPRLIPSIDLPATSVRLRATSALAPPSGGHAAPRSPAGSVRRDVEVAAWVSNPQLGTTIVNLGALHLGAWTYRGRLASDCPGGCRLAGVGLVSATGRAGASPSSAIRLTVNELLVRSPTGWAPVRADLFANGWRTGSPAVRVADNTPGSVRIDVPPAALAAYTDATGYSIGPMAAPADHPAILPGVVTTEVQSLNGASLSGGVVPSQGLDGNTLNVGSAATATALPRVGADAVMVDLGLLARYQVSSTTPYAHDEVWLGPAAPADALSRLRAAGLRVDGVQRASAVLHQLQQSAPALADEFLLVATIIALFAAGASTLGTLGANTRQRATELTALEVAGVPRRALTGALALESAVMAATALFGAGAGAVAAIIAIPSLPELASPPLIPLRYALPGGLVIAVAASVVAVILLAAGGVATVVLRRMSPLLLRMAPNDSTD
jgi:putative ABC transport system permease protein